MKRTKKIVGLSLFVLMVLSTSVSCIMDKQINIYVKNCTKDSLLIKVTRTDTLVDWQFWPIEDAHPMSQYDTRVFDDAFHLAVAGSLVLPDSMITMDPCILQLFDSCYIYAVKYSVARKYSIDDIRAKKLYDRQVVTKRDFHDWLFEYKYVRPSGNY
ncbi:hypothetical protein M1D30_00400 [Prevotella sp. E15-22]|uniref:hypothetical protein n=1 Tax=Prevotella sp. E15-22 TaxID=2937774 RepID=UPI002058C91D|nr:hypothetical protein [Prevotella sp. E15-22]UPS44663.1 hypothetical protein M1D30_00400 [Prevotella sp. E15-22]